MTMFYTCDYCNTFNRRDRIGQSSHFDPPSLPFTHSSVRPTVRPPTSHVSSVMPTDALTAFLASDFPTAEKILPALSPTTDDPRLAHNLLITRFYASRTIHSLNSILHFVASHLPSSPSITALLTLAAEDPAALKSILTKLGPVTLYNVATIAYTRGALRAAAAVANLLYSNVDVLDDWLALRLCFLLADIHLRVHDVTTAAAVTAYADRLIPQFTRTESAHQSEIPRLAPEWPGRATAVLEPPASSEDAKFCLRIYNARVSAATDGSKNRKDAKSAVVAADDPDTRPTAAALLVKARVEASLSKGLRILASVSNQSPPHVMKKVRPLALNSLGVLHHRLGRHALAACYFEEARRAFAELFGGAAGVATMSGVQDSHVCYNLALQYMKLGDFGRALELFSISARKDPTMAESEPLLWIRMAESCVAMDLGGDEKRQLLVVEGTGRGRRMVIRARPRDQGLTMEYASACARGALAILDKQKERTEAASPRKSGKTVTLSRKKETSEDDLLAIRQGPNDLQLRGAALCLLAYSSLAFDANAVIDACDELSELYPQSKDKRALLGRLYAAEALCQLGRAEEAANRLAPLLVINEPSESNLREAACMNIALSHMNSGDIDAASRTARAAFKVMNSSRQPHNLRKHASFVVAYIHLRSGETDSARQVLRSLHSLRDSHRK